MTSYSGHCGEESGVTGVETLVKEIPGLLQLLRIECPPLATAKTPPIHQCSCPTGQIAGQPLPAITESDPCFLSQFGQRAVVIKGARKSTKAGLAGPGGQRLCMSLTSVLGWAVKPQPEMTSHHTGYRPTC